MAAIRHALPLNFCARSGVPFPTEEGGGLLRPKNTDTESSLHPVFCVQYAVPDTIPLFRKLDMKPFIALSATLLLAAHSYAAPVETVDFQPDNIPTQAVLKRHSQGYSLTVAQKQPRRTLLHIRDFLPGNVTVAKLNALYGSFSVRSGTENNNFADITLRVENGRPRIASLTCHLPALSGKTMPEYDSDHNTLQLISLLEYDRDRQTLEITTTHYTDNIPGMSVMEEYPLPEPPAAALDGKHSLPEICGLFLNTVPDL